MEAYFSNLFENIRYERNLILLLSLTDTNISKQSEFTDHEKEINKKIALEKIIFRVRTLKEHYALTLLQ